MWLLLLLLLLLLSPMNVTSYCPRPAFKPTTQAQGKVGGRKGRVRISLTIPTLVIISYSKARIRRRGYNGTTTPPPKTAMRPVSHCRRAPTHTLCHTSHDVRCLSPRCGVLARVQRAPRISWKANLVSTVVRCAESSPVYARTTGIKDWGWRTSDVIRQPLSPDLTEQG